MKIEIKLIQEANSYSIVEIVLEIGRQQIGAAKVCIEEITQNYPYQYNPIRLEKNSLIFNCSTINSTSFPDIKNNLTKQELINENDAKNLIDYIILLNELSMGSQFNQLSSLYKNLNLLDYSLDEAIYFSASNQESSSKFDQRLESYKSQLKSLELKKIIPQVSPVLDLLQPKFPDILTKIQKIFPQEYSQLFSGVEEKINSILDKIIRINSLRSVFMSASWLNLIPKFVKPQNYPTINSSFQIFIIPKGPNTGDKKIMIFIPPLYMRSKDHTALFTTDASIAVFRISGVFYILPKENASLRWLIEKLKKDPTVMIEKGFHIIFGKTINPGFFANGLSGYNDDTKNKYAEIHTKISAYLIESVLKPDITQNSKSEFVIIFAACGDGKDIAKFLNTLSNSQIKNPIKIYGFDIDEENIRIARINIQNSNKTNKVKVELSALNILQIEGYLRNIIISPESNSIYIGVFSGMLTQLTIKPSDALNVFQICARLLGHLIICGVTPTIIPHIIMRQVGVEHTQKRLMINGAEVTLDHCFKNEQKQLERVIKKHAKWKQKAPDDSKTSSFIINLSNHAYPILILKMLNDKHHEIITNSVVDMRNALINLEELNLPLMLNPKHWILTGEEPWYSAFSKLTAPSDIQIKPDDILSGSDDDAFFEDYFRYPYAQP